MNGFQPEKITSVVFDFDGTLAELNLNFGEMKRRLTVLAGEYDRSATSDPKLPALEWIEKLAAGLRATNGAAADELVHKALGLIEDMEVKAAGEGCLFPFTRGLLERLRKKHVKVAVITRNCEKAVRMVFPDVERYCAAFLSREHVPRVKPDPDHLLRALRKMGASPGASLMVGDHPIDIQAGHRAGLRTAGVSSGYVSQEELARSGACWTAKNCSELMEVLEQQGLI